MSIKTLLDKLLKENIIISEVFHSGHEIRYGTQKDYVEVFKNPDMGEVDDVVRSANYDGAKIGVDKKENIYVWKDDIMHSIMQAALRHDNPKENLKFVMRFDYTKNNPILFLSQGMTKEDFDKYGSKNVIDRLRESFPEIKSIEEVSRPFRTVYTFKD